MMSYKLTVTPSGRKAFMAAMSSWLPWPSWLPCLNNATTTRATALEARLLQSSNGLDFGGPDSWIVVDFRRAAVLPDFFLLMDFQ